MRTSFILTTKNVCGDSPPDLRQLRVASLRCCPDAQARKSFGDEVEALELHLSSAGAAGRGGRAALRQAPAERLDLDLAEGLLPLDPLDLHEHVDCHRPLLIQEREQELGLAVPAQPVRVLTREVTAACAGVPAGAADNRVAPLESTADSHPDDRAAGERECVELEGAHAFAGDLERRVHTDVLREELTELLSRR